MTNAKWCDQQGSDAIKRKAMEQRDEYFGKFDYDALVGGRVEERRVVA